MSTNLDQLQREYRRDNLRAWACAAAVVLVYALQILV